MAKDRDDIRDNEATNDVNEDDMVGRAEGEDEEFEDADDVDDEDADAAEGTDEE